MQIKQANPSPTLANQTTTKLRVWVSYVHFNYSMEINAFTTVLSSKIFFELFLSAFFFYFENFLSLIRRGLPFVYDSKCLYYHRGRARDLRVLIGSLFVVVSRFCWVGRDS